MILRPAPLRNFANNTSQDVKNAFSKTPWSPFVCQQCRHEAWKEACTFYLTLLSCYNHGAWQPQKSINNCFSLRLELDTSSERKQMRLWLRFYFFIDDEISPLYKQVE